VLFAIASLDTNRSRPRIVFVW